MLVIYDVDNHTIASAQIFTRGGEVYLENFKVMTCVDGLDWINVTSHYEENEPKRGEYLKEKLLDKYNEHDFSDRQKDWEPDFDDAS